MSLIRSRYAVSRCWRLLGVLFSALLALSLFHPALATAQEVKQIKLTEKHMQGFIAVSEDMAKLSNGANQDKLDAELAKPPAEQCAHCISDLKLEIASCEKMIADLDTQMVHALAVLAHPLGDAGVGLGRLD